MRSACGAKRPAAGGLDESLGRRPTTGKVAPVGAENVPMDLSQHHPHFVPTSLRAAIAIRNATEDPQADEHRIEQLVQSEPAVAAAILRFANSAAFFRGQPIGSVHQAVLLLGLGTVRSIASHVAMMQLVRGLASPVVRSAAEALHEHVVVVSCLAQALSRVLGDEDPEQMADLALFHEMSFFVWLANLDGGPAKCKDRANLVAAARNAVLVPLDIVLLDLGIPHLGVPGREQKALLELAHGLAWVANPLVPERSRSPEVVGIEPELLEKVRQRAEALLVLIREGSRAVDNEFDEDDGSLPAPPPPPETPPVAPPADPIPSAEPVPPSRWPAAAGLAIGALALVAWWMLR